MGWMISIEWYTQRPNTLPGYLTKMLRDHVRSQATIPRKSPFTCFSCNTYCCFIFLLSQSYTSIFCIFSTNQNASQNSINQSIFSSRVFWQCLKVAKMLLTFWPRLVHFNPFRWKLSHQRKPFEVFSSSLLQNWKTIGKISTLKATLKCINITSCSSRSCCSTVVIDFSQVYYCIQKDCFLNSNGKAQITPVTQFMASASTSNPKQIFRLNHFLFQYEHSEMRASLKISPWTS